MIINSPWHPERANIIVLYIACIATYYQMKQGGNTDAGEKQTVGYSGILFAWIVVGKSINVLK